MRSILAKVLLWLAGTIALSVVGFELTSRMLVPPRPEGFDIIERTQVLQLEGARAALATEGRDGLARYLERLDRLFRAEHRLVDDRGWDLLDGSDRSPLVAIGGRRLRPGGGPPDGPPRGWLPGRRGQRSGPLTPDGRFVILSPADGGSRLLILVPAMQGRPNIWPYYLWILVAIAALAWALAIHLVRPLRTLRRAVERFGRGDLATRAQLRRRDEIGELSRAFDEMAGTIETLLDAERRLLQDVSHELRSPLARLGFAVELARSNPDHGGALDRIERDVHRLSELVGGLLQLTRAEGDRSAVRREAVAADELLLEVVDDCSIEAEAKGGTLALAQCDAATLAGDRELLRRVIENVTRNAVRHAPPGTRVDVSLTAMSDRVRIVMRDRGPGVPAELLDAIFEPFVRVEGDRSRETGGVGLGLSIARRAIALHGGTIVAENEQPGLKVTLELPLAPEDAVPPIPEASDGVPGSKRTAIIDR